MESIKESAANVAASAKSGLENAKVAMGQSQGGSYSNSTTGEKGQPTGGHQMSALPGHGTGEPAGQVTEGTAKSHPIGVSTGTGRSTTAHNTHVGSTGGQGYGTGGTYSG